MTAIKGAQEPTLKSVVPAPFLGFQQLTITRTRHIITTLHIQFRVQCFETGRNVVPACGDIPVFRAVAFEKEREGRAGKYFQLIGQNN